MESSFTAVLCVLLLVCIFAISAWVILFVVPLYIVKKSYQEAKTDKLIEEYNNK